MEFEGIILKPTGQWSEETLRSITESIIDRRVEDEPSPNSGPYGAEVGKVTEAEYVDGEGVKCTIEVYNSTLAEKVDEGLVKFAPALMQDSENLSDASFHSVFMTPRPTDDVGDFDRKI